MVSSLNGNSLVRLIYVGPLPEHIDGLVYQRCTLIQAEDHHLQFTACKVHELGSTGLFQKVYDLVSRHLLRIEE